MINYGLSAGSFFKWFMMLAAPPSSIILQFYFWRLYENPISFYTLVFGTIWPLSVSSVGMYVQNSSMAFCLNNQWNTTVNAWTTRKQISWLCCKRDSLYLLFHNFWLLFLFLRVINVFSGSGLKIPLFSLFHCCGWHPGHIMILFSEQLLNNWYFSKDICFINLTQ